MKCGIFALVALMLAAAKPVSAAICELSAPPIARVPEASHFIATTTRGGVSANEVRAQVIVGRTDSAAMARGAVILVPRSHGRDCRPVPWDIARDGGPWSPPEGASFYTGVLRPRSQWIDGLPTVDIHMAHQQPAWHGFASTAWPLLTPQEFFDFYPFLPTYEEYREKQTPAFRRLMLWESAHQALAARQPVRSILDRVYAREGGVSDG
jgi:hypothetical protein